MSIEIAEEMVDILRGNGISIPLSYIESKKCFVRMRLRLFIEPIKVIGKVFFQLPVEILTK